MMKNNKSFLIAGLISLILFSILLAPVKAETLCSYEGPDVSEDLLRLTNFSVTGNSLLKEGDSVTVKFSLENFGQSDVNLGAKGIFAAAKDPDDNDVSFGFSYSDTVLECGGIRSIEVSKVMDKTGAWVIWPSYHLSLATGEKLGPNEWHACSLSVSAAIEDSDQDGIADDEDNCPQSYNPDQKDRDEDSIGDVCDNCPYKSNKDQKDSDNDEVGDICERPMLTLTQTPLKPDPDEKVTFIATADDPDVIEEIDLWVNNEMVKECSESPCAYIGGPYPEGVIIFDANGSDDQGYHIPSRNLIIEGVSYDIPHRIPSETCPLCPQIAELGMCVEQTCTGPSMPEPYEQDSVTIGCLYANQGSTTPMIFISEIGGGEGNESRGGFYSDYCDGDDVIEYYCSGGMMRNSSYNCPNGCERGACICNDSDGGKEYYIRGTAGDKTDTCVNLHGDAVSTSSHLKEYFCGSDGIEEEEVRCACQEGACQCIDTDNGINYYDKGRIAFDPLDREDECINPSRIREYYCDGNEVKEHESNCFSCENGECICEDPDGGLNYYVHGCTVGVGIGCDYCKDANHLMEYYTKIEGSNCNSYCVEEVECPDGCDGGACRETCSDGIQNQDEEGIDCGGSCPAQCFDCFHLYCGGVPYECSGQLIPGGGEEAGKFSLDDPIVRERAKDALMEYANCLTNASCREHLPTVNLIADYSEINVTDLELNSDAIMEAVAFYVDKHMHYMYDPDDVVENGCNPDDDLHAQSARYTIEESGLRSGKIRDLYLFNINIRFESTLNNEILSEELMNLFRTNGVNLTEDANVYKEDDARWKISDEEDYEIVKDIPDTGDPRLNVFKVWALECPKDYCGDCEDHAILRAALMRSLGIPWDCVYCADHYDGYWGGGHTFNIVNYRSKWRIMDYGTLGSNFLTKENMHVPHNLWNDEYGVIYCPDWRDNLGDGYLDCGCNKISPKKNYEVGSECPSEEDVRDDVPSGLQTYRTDICP